MDKWDDHFKALLSFMIRGRSAEGWPVESEVWKGDLYLHGICVLPAAAGGVPGAVRLYVNLLSAKQVVVSLPVGWFPVFQFPGSGSRGLVRGG